jgi:ferritin heavy chain
MSESNGDSVVRQNYHPTSEANVNKQISLELYASYVYMSMAYYFDRDDVAFPGLFKFFKKNSDEEREHAEKFMKYQNSRGGRIILQPIAKPSNDEWTSPAAAMHAALELEKTVNKTLLQMHATASDNGDAHLCDFLESEFLNEQVEAIKELADYCTQLKRCGPGLGEYIFDKELSEK